MKKGRSTAEEYHRLTKYREETLRSGPGLDWSRQPDQFKDIVSSKRVSLRSFLPYPAGSGGTGKDQDFTLARLGRLLFYSYGVTGVIRFQNGGSQLLRASPSAGALYPTEIYVALRDVPGVEPGLYNYQVRTHELVLLWEGDQMEAIAGACGGDVNFAESQAAVVMTGLYWRSAWRYQERGYRRVLLDTGHVLANLMSYAAHEGCRTRPIYGFLDASLNGHFFFNENVEGTLLCAPLLEGDGLQEPAPLWASPPAATVELQPAPLKAETELPESASVLLHRASSCAEPKPVDLPKALCEPPVGEGSVVLDPPGDLEESIPGAIVERRSARSYSGEPVPLSKLGRAVGYAFGRGEGKERTMRCATRDAGLLRAHLLVHDVDGMAPGLYLVEGAGQALRPLVTRDLKEAFYHASLGQEIARRCGAALIFTAPAREALSLCGDRAYRYLHMEAGLIGERLQLAAGALGLGACGIAGFLDDESAALMRCEKEDFVLYFVTVGRS
ncbi:MAG: SagB family peptide dehydrogenase [Planctomycetota bacterium]